jgi:bifunctional UDP-N-acetylglucosamine pyrophosphorylase/glucosamine-1-phosphate N-acetyltransferase
MPELRVLIAAAGSGTRAGLPYPKTLHPVQGRPILVRLIELLRQYDPVPAVVVSPSGRQEIEQCLERYGLAAELVEQDAPTGMGDAILCFRKVDGWRRTQDVMAVWGDIPLLQPQTVAAMVAAHREARNDFTFVSRHVDAAYTVVSRDESGSVVELIETREAGISPPAGERDIGLFLFRAAPVLDLLDLRLDGAFGRSTGEHGFLYIVRHLAARGHKVDAVPLATDLDLVSLNRLSDLAGFESGVGG